ncbi:isoprenyl transferase [Phreatobacter aquaticus]|uniref:Isoprenyl transferase n=1 Tax=Phreatobacter aquaticus TaxID=2570229 RepID=A0A4D7QJ31_9HYPH|nr:isoprenyl transferase [Phreatobacter aquaticus]QCK87508.1 isoprenyl transferase [Phreatobacter aquaticus]
MTLTSRPGREFDQTQDGPPADEAGRAPGLPRHVAIIMDGNGRWAQARGLPRVEGHRRGVDALRRTLRAAREIGIEVVTVYSFSSENWSRPFAEVSALMGLLKRFIRNDLAELHEAGVRVRVSGERAGLEPDIRRLLEEAEALTAANSRQTLVVAFNYGARQEIAQAARLLAEEVAAGLRDAASITPDVLEAKLGTAGIPDPDLIIRTSGEVRLSNFMLWQAAYSELVFQPILWPDYGKEPLMEALAEYQRRDRRFGGVAAASGG